MAGRKRAAAAHDDSSEDSIVVSPPSKKKQKASASSATAGGADGSSIGGAPAPMKTDEGDEFWEIPTGSKRRITLQSFKNMPMVSIREYYDAGSGDMRPGKKGISLTVPQFAALVSALPAIEQSLKDRGHEIPRPEYPDGSSTARDKKIATAGKKGLEDDEEEGTMEDEPASPVKREQKIKRDRGKKNFEETSDEEE